MRLPDEFRSLDLPPRYFRAIGWTPVPGDPWAYCGPDGQTVRLSLAGGNTVSAVYDLSAAHRSAERDLRQAAADLPAAAEAGMLPRRSRTAVRLLQRMLAR